MTKPKGVRVRVERYEAVLYEEDHIRRVIMMHPARRTEERVPAIICARALHLAGVPRLRPGDSVTGRMVFVPDRPRRGKK